jgi:hypothetical protein
VLDWLFGPGLAEPPPPPPPTTKNHPVPAVFQVPLEVKVPTTPEIGDNCEATKEITAVPDADVAISLIKETVCVKFTAAVVDVVAVVIDVPAELKNSIVKVPIVLAVILYKPGDKLILLTL